MAALARTVARAFGRELVFLPAGTHPITIGTQNATLLPLRYTRRASPQGLVAYELQRDGSDLSYTLYSMAFSNGLPRKGELCLSFKIAGVRKGARLQVGLVEPAARMDGREIQLSAYNHRNSRKFIADIEVSEGVHLRRRSCCHYLPFTGKPIGRDYYFGDDYVDYPEEVHPGADLKLVKAYCSGGRLLDIGCALGLHTKAFLDAGYDAYGIDVSEFAIADAAHRIGPERVRQCDLDVAAIPFDGNFDILWMCDVLEHSTDPERMLERATERARSGSWLFLHTANSESLTHRTLEGDWEAYSDYSHHGVERVGATSLRRWLRDLAWEIVSWQCSGCWVVGVDPVLLRLGEAFHKIPELRVFLEERDLGDMIAVVARKP